MSTSYTFTKIVNKSDAFEAYIRTKISWVDVYNGFSTYTDNIVIYVQRELTEQEIADLTIYVNEYIDPEFYLVFDRTDSMALHSDYSNDPSNVVINNKDVLQTFIFTNRNSPETVLDGMKTIVEYNIPNVQNFVDVLDEDAFINLEIYDITRDITITNQNIPLNEIAAKWRQMAQNNSTDSDVVYRSAMFTGLMNKTPDHDCVWQIRGYVQPPEKFAYRINGLQYLFYNVQY